MTRQEAIEAMERGDVITHERFTRGTFLYKINDDLYDENGWYSKFKDFNENWSFNVYDDGWKIIEPECSNCINSALIFFRELKSELDRMPSYDIPIRVNGRLIKNVKLTGDLTIEITTL